MGACETHLPRLGTPLPPHVRTRLNAFSSTLAPPSPPPLLCAVTVAQSCRICVDPTTPSPRRPLPPSRIPRLAHPPRSLRRRGVRTQRRFEDRFSLDKSTRFQNRPHGARRREVLRQILVGSSPTAARLRRWRLKRWRHVVAISGNRCRSIVWGRFRAIAAASCTDGTRVAEVRAHAPTPQRSARGSPDGLREGESTREVNTNRRCIGTQTWNKCFRGASGGKCSGGRCSGGKCSGGKCSGGRCSGGRCSGGRCSDVRCSGGRCSRGRCSRGRCSRGRCSASSLSLSHMRAALFRGRLGKVHPVTATVNMATTHEAPMTSPVWVPESTSPAIANASSRAQSKNARISSQFEFAYYDSS